jgi:hypothetical protein
VSDLETLLATYLKSDNYLQQNLAVYNGEPAITGLFAPKDTSPLWETDQYPRLVFVVDRNQNPERGVTGILTVYIHAKDGLDADIAERLKGLLSGAVFAADEEVVATYWRGSDRTPPAAAMPYSETVADFDLAGFPNERTNEEEFFVDIISSFEKWSRNQFPHLEVAPETYVPTNERPALFWRLTGRTPTEYLGLWTEYSIGVVGHILAPGHNARVAWTRRIARRMNSERAIELSDTSDVRIENASEDYTAGPLTAGQITVIGLYGEDVEELPGISTMTTVTFDEVP